MQPFEQDLQKIVVVSRLTPRERDCIAGIGHGLTNKEIAKRLGLSESTVKFYNSKIFAKLGVSSRLEAYHRYHAELARCKQA